MGCSPSSLSGSSSASPPAMPSSIRGDQQLLAFAIAQENYLRHQHGAANDLGVYNPMWMQTVPDSTALNPPPAYSEEPPPGHTSHGCSRQSSLLGLPMPSNSGGERPYSTTPTSRQSTPGTPLPEEGQANRSNRRRSLPATSASNASGSSASGGTRHHRISLRARRRISPLPISTPSSQRSLRSSGDSAVQLAIQSMTRPTTTSSSSSSVRPRTATGGTPDRTADRYGYEQRDDVQQLAQGDETALPAADSGGAPSGLTSRPSQACEGTVGQLAEEIGGMQVVVPACRDGTAIMPGQTDSTCEARQPPDPSDTAHTPNALPEHQRSNIPSSTSEGVRRQLFPTSGQSPSDWTPSVGELPPPWHAQMLAVGKRSQSQRGHSLKHVSSRSRHSRGQRPTEAEDGTTVPEAPKAQTTVSGEVYGSRMPKALAPINQKDTSTLGMHTSTSGEDGGTSAQQRRSPIAPLLRPVRRQNLWQLPHLDSGNAPDGGMPTAGVTAPLGRLDPIGRPGIQGKLPQNFILNDTRSSAPTPPI